MEESDKKKLRELKADVVADLTGRADIYGRYRHVLSGTDRRLEDYVRMVLADPDGHNLYEVLKIRRYFDLAERYKWNEKLVRHKIKFYEALKFSGTSGRRSYKLTPVQTFQMAHIYGFARDDGRRLIRLAYIFVPRKFSKTTFAAFMAVDDMLFGDSNAEAYIGANSYDQAKKCFNEVRAIMFSLDPNQKHFRINRESVRFRDQSRDSLVQCLTANARTKDGLFASLAILDEYAQARNTGTKGGADLKNVLTSSMGPRRSPLTVVITTASSVIDGPCYEEIQGAEAVLRGEVQNDAMFADLFMPDVDDEDGDPKTWAKVQPHLGVTVQPDFYEAEWANAQLSSSNMLEFRTKLLNRFVVGERKMWFTHEAAMRLVSRFNIDEFQGRPLSCMAFDLSVHDDFSAVSYAVYNYQNKHFYIHTDYYFPEGALAGHYNEGLYREWHRKGYLKLCKGNCIDVNRIAEDIIARSRILNIVQVGYDSFDADALVNILYTIGGRGLVVPYSQSYGNFNKAVESFELSARVDPPLVHMNDNPINVFCLTNCVLDEDRLENKKPIKVTHTRKIDGTISMLMAFQLLSSREM